MRSTILILSLVAACTDDAFTLSELPPDGVELLGCGPHPPAVAGESSELMLTIANYNRVDLRVEFIDIEAPFSAPLERPPFLLPGGFGSDLTVLFAPRAPGPKVGELVIGLNAPPHELRCALSGEAR